MPTTNSTLPKIKLSQLISEKDKVVKKLKKNYNNIKFSHTKRDAIDNFDSYIDKLVKEQSSLRKQLIKIKVEIQKYNLPILSEIYELSELKVELAELKYLTSSKYVTRQSEVYRRIKEIEKNLENHNQKDVPFWTLNTK